LISELKGLKKRYATPRRTRLVEGGDELVAQRAAAVRPNAELQRQQAFAALSSDSRLLIQADGAVRIVNAQTLGRLHLDEAAAAADQPAPAQLILPISGQPALLSDTVGFIQKLPTFLVQAFRATLEEVLDADILLHIWDVSHPEALEQLQAVEDTLDQLGVQDKPRLTVCNKIDRKPDWQSWVLTQAPADIEPVTGISALTGEGLEKMLAKLDALCQDLSNPLSSLTIEHD
jgi:hypothetical protein